jgi:hypothetical protein
MLLEHVKISVPGGGREQKVPMSFVSSFGKWIIHEGRLQSLIDTDSLEKGWVDPVSFEEVWLPLDLPSPKQRPAIAALVKDGAIRCIMPALDISIHASGQRWWNRGMCSFPFARVWMDLKTADIAQLVLTAYTQVSEPTRKNVN